MTVYKYISLYILSIIGIFIEFSFLGSAGNIILKILIIAGISYFLYELWKSEVEESSPDKRESIETKLEPVSSSASNQVFEISGISLNRLLSKEPSLTEYLRSEFTLIWSFIIPNNGYIFIQSGNDPLKMFTNKQSANLSINKDNHPENLIKLIDQHNGILLEKDIQPAANLLPFYDEETYEPRSLLAFKTLIENDALYWIFDSKTPAAFNDDDIPVIENINKTVDKILRSSAISVGKEHIYQGSIKNLAFAKMLNSMSSLQGCIELFSEKLIEEFQASKLTIAFKNESDHQKPSATIKKSVGIDDPFKVGYEFNLDEGLNGWVIAKNKPYLIDNIDKGDYFIPRFTRDEKTNYDLRSFLSVPISIDDTAYGVVTLEDKKINKYQDEEKFKLQQLTELFAAAAGRYKKKQKDTEEIDG